jgi:hypothetical protein
MFDTTFVILGTSIIATAIALSLLIERLTKAFGASPADPDEQSRGFRDVISRVGNWLEHRSRPDRLDRD